ncbi:6-phosphofructokinase [Agrobacterium vitis]|nr:6-phosphofructokinase [Agrobacterium vitis]MBE1439696.1 6-phosphofructokinase [Agrobacterium vitis]
MQKWPLQALFSANFLVLALGHIQRQASRKTHEKPLATRIGLHTKIRNKNFDGDGTLLGLQRFQTVQSLCQSHVTLLETGGFPVSEAVGLAMVPHMTEQAL